MLVVVWSAHGCIVAGVLLLFMNIVSRASSISPPLVSLLAFNSLHAWPTVSTCLHPKQGPVSLYLPQPVPSGHLCTLACPKGKTYLVVYSTTLLLSRRVHFRFSATSKGGSDFVGVWSIWMGCPNGQELKSKERCMQKETSTPLQSVSVGQTWNPCSLVCMVSEQDHAIKSVLPQEHFTYQLNQNLGYPCLLSRFFWL